jgi:hypothetical protein
VGTLHLVNDSDGITSPPPFAKVGGPAERAVRVAATTARDEQRDGGVALGVGGIHDGERQSVEIALDRPRPGPDDLVSVVKRDARYVV